MISHRHKVIFIHIPKCAGTSIEQAFLNDLNLKFNQRIGLACGRVKMEENNVNLSHLTISELLKYGFVNKEMLTEYSIFTVVRHPIKRLISTYQYLGYKMVYNFNYFVVKLLPKLVKSNRYSKFLMPQTEYISNNLGIKLDEIVKFEKLNEEWPRLAKMSGLKCAKIPHVNQGRPKTTLINNLKRIVLINAMHKTKNLNLRKNSNSLSFEGLKTIRSIYELDFKNFDYIADAD